MQSNKLISILVALPQTHQLFSSWQLALYWLIGTSLVSWITINNGWRMKTGRLGQYWCERQEEKWTRSKILVNNLGMVLKVSDGLNKPLFWELVCTVSHSTDKPAQHTINTKSTGKSIAMGFSDLPIPWFETLEMNAHFKACKTTIYLTTIHKNQVRNERTSSFHGQAGPETCCPVNHVRSCATTHRGQTGWLMPAHMALSCSCSKEKSWLSGTRRWTQQTTPSTNVSFFAEQYLENHHRKWEITTRPMTEQERIGVLFPWPKALRRTYWLP